MIHPCPHIERADPDHPRLPLYVDVSALAEGEAVLSFRFFSISFSCLHLLLFPGSTHEMCSLAN